MDNKSIILKIQEMQVQIEMLNRKIEEKQPQEVAKVTVDKRAIAEQVEKSINLKSLELDRQLSHNNTMILKSVKDKTNNMIDEKVTMNFINKLYRNK